jgi:hypothetical protein
MLQRSFLMTAVLWSAAWSASADVIEAVTVNTSSISGDAGSLDFQFNPGPLVTQAASLQILNFITDGSLANCAANIQGFCPTGDVSGTLPGTVTFDNGTGFNDYFDGFTYGNSLSFDVVLSGPAINSPDGVSTSGSTFAFSMFSDAAGTVPALTSDLTNGFATTINVNLDGTTTVNNFSAVTTISKPSVVPEPATFAVTGILLGLIGGVVRFRRRAQS